MHIITSATVYIKYLFHTHIYNTTHFFSLFLLFQHFQTEILKLGHSICVSHFYLLDVTTFTTASCGSIQKSNKSWVGRSLPGGSKLVELACVTVGTGPSQ